MNRLDLTNYIEGLMGSTLSSLVLNQISRYLADGYSYSDIGLSLDYYANVLGRPLDPKYGIGIVPHVLAEAREYFDKIYAEEDRLREQGEKLKNMKMEKVKVTPVKQTRRRPTIDIRKELE